jgi:hypothetical protein
MVNVANQFAVLPARLNMRFKARTTSAVIIQRPYPCQIVGICIYIRFFLLRLGTILAGISDGAFM